MRRICKQELLEMAKAKGKKVEWAKKFFETVKESMCRPDDNYVYKLLVDCKVDGDCINEILQKSEVSGYPTIIFDYNHREIPSNVWANYSYAGYLIGISEDKFCYNTILTAAGQPDVEELNDNSFYPHNPQDMFDSTQPQDIEYWRKCDNVFTEIFRHSFGIEEVYLAFLLCDENLETFYDFVGYGTEPKPEPEPSDLPADRQTLVGDLYSTVRPMQMMYEMLKADKPIDKVALKKYLTQLDMKCKALSADFENILNM